MTCNHCGRREPPCGWSVITTRPGLTCADCARRLLERNRVARELDTPILVGGD